MKEYIDYFATIATSYKGIGHSPTTPRFAGSIDEYELLSKSKIPLTQFAMVIDVDLADWQNNPNSEAETEITNVHIFVVKQGKSGDWARNYQILQDSRQHIMKIYSRLMKDRKEGVNSVLRFFNPQNKTFDYIRGKELPQLYGSVLSVPVKRPVGFAFDPADWN